MFYLSLFVSWFGPLVPLPRHGAPVGPRFGTRRLGSFFYQLVDLVKGASKGKEPMSLGSPLEQVPSAGGREENLCHGW